MSSPDSLAPPAPALTLGAIEAHIGARSPGDPQTLITGVNALELAGPGELTFAEFDKYAPLVRRTRAGAVIVSKSFPDIEGHTLLRVDHPRLAFVKVMYLFQAAQEAAKPPAGIHRDAVVAPDAELGEGVTIRECAVIRPRARIGAGTLIESGVHIGEGVVIGERCTIGPNVVIRHGSRIGHRVIIHGGTVIGADGFGYVWTEGRHLKIPQLGNVIIEDDVELGANVCVDRATLGSTLIKRGTKVDNLVQIAHNDVIGEHVLMSGQAGLAGSVTVGDRVIMGGKAGVVDHTAIGDDARLGAAAVVIGNIPAGRTVWGFPARELKTVKRELAALAFLPKVLKQLNRSRRAAAPKKKSSAR
ncbi:MAG: UDP-3-O-(3-hydroxymyristoyl)glucosamine N-acyltransferase [Candidatus Omnitrophica bacterium]|nr:UDP-3-O-(3-hydroxymyristoyl)glucosamine N-acyltransferase [Candidatus Omnitrophota bacterium]